MEFTQSYALGIDIGGTFTDAYLVSLESGHSFQAKVPTTPSNLVSGVVDCIFELGRAGALGGKNAQNMLQGCAKLAHATTQSTNAIFTRTGAKTGLITTAGFRDTTAIMRAFGRVAGLTIAERQHYSKTDKPVPIVPMELIEEVVERVDYAGKVVVPLQVDDAKERIRRLLGTEVEAVAICLLWSFKNQENEKQIESIIKSLAPNIYVTVSSKHFPLIGEYERTITSVLNAYVGPVMISYLNKLEDQFSKMGLKSPPLIVTSQGGAVSPSRASEIPIVTVESGPAAGIIGSQYVADLIGVENAVVTDVGGTTFKVGVIAGGKPLTTQTSTITQFVVANPMLEVLSIGSGGGSIAWIDGNRLRVGPRSAQAEPGPACYGRGGTEPTVTDADVVLGYINPNYFLSGRMKLQKELAHQAIAKIAAELFGGDVIRAAAGIREIVDAQMSDLIRKATMERGLDIRDFSLFAYGGAGPTHAGQYARDLPIRNIITPYFATVHSALGAVVSDIVHVYEHSDPQLLSASLERIDPNVEQKIQRIFEGMESIGSNELSSERITTRSTEFRRYLYIRYRRQVHPILVPVVGSEDLGSTIRRFENLYEMTYGKGSVYKEAGIEITTFRVEAIGRLVVPPLKAQEKGAADPTTAIKSTRQVYWPERRDFVDTPTYAGERLVFGNRIVGPAVIEHYGTTIVLHEGNTGTIDQYLNTVITRRG